MNADNLFSTAYIAYPRDCTMEARANARAQHEDRDALHAAVQPINRIEDEERHALKRRIRARREEAKMLLSMVSEDEEDEIQTRIDAAGERFRQAAKDDLWNMLFT